MTRTEGAQQIWSVGVDWGYHAHQVCVVNPAGEAVWESCVPHTAEAIEALVNNVVERAGGSTAVVVAIELPSGAVVEAFLQRGVAVYSINPKQVDRFRDRFSPAGAKDDRRDAYVLATAIRTDAYAFRKLIPLPDELQALRELDKLRQTLVEDEVRLVHRLREALHSSFLQVLALVPGADQPWMWALLAQAPTPEEARRILPDELRGLLRRQRAYHLDPDEVYRKLRDPDLPQPQAVAKAMAVKVRILAGDLLDLRRRLREVERELRFWLRQVEQGEEEGLRRDMELLSSIPGMGPKLLTAVVTEAAFLLQGRDYHGLRVLAGVAPVTRQSGRTRQVRMRRACNPRMRNAVFLWATAAVRKDPWWEAQYRKLRERGIRIAQARRILGDRLLRVAVAMLRDGTTYSPDTLGATKEEVALQACPA